MVNSEQPEIRLYDPQRFAVVTRYSCVRSCPMCIFSCTPSDPVEIPDELLDRYVAAAVERQVKDFIITGGEPMLNPEQVFRTLRTAKQGGLITRLGSTFLGYTKEEVSDNAAKLKDAGLDTYLSSISASHYLSHPKKIAMPYEEYMAKAFESIVSNGIELTVRTVYDPGNEALVSRLNDDIIFKKLNPDIPVGNASCNVEGRVFSKCGVEIVLILDKVLSTDKARKNNISYGKGNFEYLCMGRDIACYDVLLLYPDGNVSICCNAERSVDFGFGNANEMSIDQIIENIRNNPLIDDLFPKRLRAAHKVMQEEFPGTLPKDGTNSVCEVCSSMAAHPEVKERLKKEELFKGCF